LVCPQENCLSKEKTRFGEGISCRYYIKGRSREKVKKGVNNEIEKHRLKEVRVKKKPK